MSCRYAGSITRMSCGRARSPEVGVGVEDDMLCCVRKLDCWLDRYLDKYLGGELHDLFHELSVRGASQAVVGILYTYVYNCRWS